MQGHFPQKAFRTSYRKGYANLKELLASSKIDNKEVKKRNYNGSCSKCGKCGQSNRGKNRAKGLNQRKVIREGIRFKSNSTGETFRIRQHITCRSNNIIYLVTGRECRKQGVGSTTNVFQRISNYLSHIEVKYNEGTIVAHFFEGNCTINQFSIMGIVQLADPPKRKSDIRIKLEELEGGGGGGYWKVRLNTLKPFGLNTINEFANKTGKMGVMMELV